MPEPFLSSLERHARAVDARLSTALAPDKRSERLLDAMRHAIFAGGKRLRPYLVIESAKLFGIEGDAPLQIAAALECVHCYSLVHDDLPSMDNDDTRRGQPTVHRAYDEASAILAGDALLTLAFSLLSGRGVAIRSGARLKLIAALADASGIDGMVGGQMLDLAAEGRFGAPGQQPQKLGLKAIRRLQSLKTGALFRFAVLSGAMLAPKVGAGARRALSIYGDCLGLAFQIKDDLLDVEGDAAIVGKALAKDAGAGKATFVGLMGREGARAELEAASARGRAALEAAFGARAAMLVAVLDYNRDRNH